MKKIDSNGIEGQCVFWMAYKGRIHVAMAYKDCCEFVTILICLEVCKTHEFVLRSMCWCADTDSDSSSADGSDVAQSPRT